eukprot:TRINITY_DN5088_c0_g1_i2.p1 TRINITY_DN5088_c0_g1~~TRINITY_DN5088_c0_g1_i2.p1  ORF type:complete len:208 (+),score=55.52 TRINITY_DN5088_c0_g1_i2:81-704(+)
MSKTRVYVGKVSNRTRKRDLEDLFIKYGRILSCDLKYNYAFVEFDDPRDAEDAVRELDGVQLDGSSLIVEFSKGGRDRGGRDRGGFGSRGSDRGRDRSARGTPFSPPQRSEYRILIDNLPRDMSWQDLKDHFRKTGDVVFGDVFEDSGKFKGVIEFKYFDDLTRAIKDMDGTKIRGNTIDVIEKEEDAEETEAEAEADFLTTLAGLG